MAMNLGGCIGLRRTTVSRRSSIFRSGHHEVNVYIGKNLFEDKNYQAILDCLDGGYAVSTSLLKSMEEYLELRQENVNQLSSYSKKCTLRLDQQSSLSIYHTTKAAQLQTYEIFEPQAKLEKDSCDNIQPVIDNYRKQVNQMFPRPRFSTTHKHYRTDEMKRLFERARLPLCKVLKELAELRKKEKKLSDAINNGTVESRNPNLDPTANLKRRENQNKLQDIQENVVLAETKRRQKEANYIVKATQILEQCQELEKTRLDQIEQALIDFIQAIHPSQYSTELIKIYDNLLLDIKTKQNSIEDLDYWAQTYGINNLTITASSKQDENKNDNDRDSAIGDDNNDHDSTADNAVNEDQQSVAIANIIPVKPNTLTDKELNNTS